MNSLELQYIILAVILLFAGYYLFRMVRKTFSLKKFKKGKGDCDSNCGCS